MLTQATASEIPISTYLADLSLLTPKNVWFTARQHLHQTVPVGTLDLPAQLRRRPWAPSPSPG